MSAVSELTTADRLLEDSEIIHVRCCAFDDYGWPMRSLCGAPIHEEADENDPSPECVVCSDLDDSEVCPYFGRCAL